MSAPVAATLGCRPNALETEAMKALAERAGAVDAVVANACAVTGDAVRKVRLEVRRLHRQHPGACIVVTGRAAQVEPKTFAAMPEASLVLGDAETLDRASWSRMAPDPVGEAERVAVGDITAARETAHHLIHGVGARGRGTSRARRAARRRSRR